MKNAIPFFSISLAFMKPEISAAFFSDKMEFFRISPRYYSSQFPHVNVLFHFSRMYGIFHFACSSQIKKVILMEFSSF